MSIRREREAIKREILAIESLIQKAARHPVMLRAYRTRLEDLERALQALPPVGVHEPKATLYFSGEPVQGSIGIDADFVGRVLEPFQSMVMADYAERWNGRVGTRGTRARERESRLLLTGLPRGSVGLELKKSDSDELFQDEQLSSTLAHITKLIGASARSDEDFVSELEETSPRVVNNLKKFLSTISKGNAGLNLETGDMRLQMDSIQAKMAFDRVTNTTSDVRLLSMKGELWGLLSADWKFNFVPENDAPIRGRLSEDITTEQADGLLRRFYKSPSKALIERTIVIFRNGNIRTNYILFDLRSPDEPDFDLTRPIGEVGVLEPAPHETLSAYAEEPLVWNQSASDLESKNVPD